MALRRTPLARKSELKRGTRIAPANKKRRAKRYRETFGLEKAAWVRTLPCLGCGRTPSEAAHAKSRGAGGTAAHLVPLCHRCHREQHQVGILTFQASRRLDLLSEAEHYHRAWILRGAA
jgi:hypothetical protein